MKFLMKMTRNKIFSYICSAYYFEIKFEKIGINYANCGGNATSLLRFLGKISILATGSRAQTLLYELIYSYYTRAF